MTNHTLGGTRPWRLGARTRKGVLVVHIVSAGVDRYRHRHGRRYLPRPPSRRRQHQGALLPGLELFAVWPLLTAGLVCLASGVVLGLGTKYGLVRYWWVAIKLMLNIVLTALVLIALRPEVSKAAEQG